MAIEAIPTICVAPTELVQPAIAETILIAEHFNRLITTAIHVLPATTVTIAAGVPIAAIGVGRRSRIVVVGRRAILRGRRRLGPIVIAAAAVPRRAAVRRREVRPIGRDDK